MTTKKQGAPGWAAAEGRMATRQQGRTTRLRVHDGCLLDGDEKLGLSALTGATCGRCKDPIEGAAVVVQRFR